MVKFSFQSEDGLVSYGDIRFSLSASSAIVFGVIEAVCREIGCVAVVSIIKP